MKNLRTQNQELHQKVASQVQNIEELKRLHKDELVQQQIGSKEEALKDLFDKQSELHYKYETYKSEYTKEFAEKYGKLEQDTVSF